MNSGRDFFPVNYKKNKLIDKRRFSFTHKWLLQDQVLGVEDTLTFSEELISLRFREYDGKMLKNGESKH